MGSTYHSAVIAAPVDRVWPALRDFHDVSWAGGVLTRCEPVGDRRGDQVGARRILNGLFHETLVGLDDRDRTMRYRIDDAPSPVSPREVHDFVARLHVAPITASGETLVELSASWDGADEPARDFAGGIYDAILADLRRTLTGGGGGSGADR